ncbi:Dot/Icm secretion system ATPase DotB (plasmid) [Desulfosarcina ovata subsp. sediminis]|uniref:Dot/Icm secretion system ATPase DotB n=1 Tax=Desulfosarcina ovata subsp. sediminis TaxID=885957 RepID=A0A5K8A2T4_9BACT|nr:ATPase, T2SS/T4P/T4SS family [Desulfosarcina ovata]BBO86756.1 Dot/Icm secretion system ATPase DotB [Desulfosarcina ovata subsp. sediminis]
MNLYKDEPKAIWTIDNLNNFVLWASNRECSDITFRPNTPVWVRLHGKWVKATERAVNSNEIYALIDASSHNKSSSARIKGGDQYDFAFEIKESRFRRRRFRVNAAACRDGWASGATMTIRAIPSTPPKLSQMNIDQSLWDGLFPENGLVLVTGVMGTGKSTLLASTIREIAETRHKHIITYEQPIEFDLMGIEAAQGPIEQTEIPMHLRSFKEAPKNAARRAADVILVGESRDPETMRGILELTEMGVAGYTTVHTRNVPETVARIINMFEIGQQKQAATTLISCLKCIVQQRLLPGAKGGRVAIREWLTFDAADRERLIRLDVERIVPEIWQMLRQKGVTLIQSTKEQYEAGRIRKESLSIIEEEYKGFDG